jgi:hypothetical protein
MNSLPKIIKNQEDSFRRSNPSVLGVFIPLWQRGIKGDSKIMLVKSPLTPLCPPGQRPYGPAAKEGYKGTLVLLEPITEGSQGQWFLG